MRILVTGSSGVLGRLAVPALRGAGHHLHLPARRELDLLDSAQVTAAVGEVDAVVHLATRIPPPERMGISGAWEDNDRLRDTATALLAHAGLTTGAEVIVVPTVAFVYPPGPADESTPPADVSQHLRSALRAEEHLRTFTAAGRRGVALRLGSLYGPHATTATPSDRYTAQLHTADAATAIAIAAALAAPPGIYNVVDDTGPVSHQLFTATTGWHPHPAQ